MAHITFVHGIDNKPTVDVLLRSWRDALRQGGGGIDLEARGVSSSMVYWADALYPEPEAHVEIMEAGAEAARVEVMPGVPEAPAAPSVEEAAFMAGLAAKIGGTLAAPENIEGVAPDRSENPSSIERVPLPWFIKRRFLERFLRDVHHYLFNVEYSPRPGSTYKVQDEIRDRFITQLNAASAGGRPHIVVSHSMGTVIAYDCLKRVDSCPQVDGFITIGSPLGLDEVQDKLQPGWTREDGFPNTKVPGRWINIFDRLDPVDGFDPFLANDYQARNSKVIHDLEVRNQGPWRHAIVEYLQRSELRRAIDSMLRP